MVSKLVQAVREQENKAKHNFAKTRAESAAVARAVEERSKKSLMIVNGISEGHLVNIAPVEFNKLDVDPRYQRGQTTMVNQIVRALQAGGMVHDPVTLCQRPWDTDTSKYWIVDGYQRVCAHQSLSLPFKAMVHESESLDAEKRFFLLLNQKRNVSPNLTVKAWPGLSGEMLRIANSSKDSALYNRIELGQTAHDGKIPSSTLARALAQAVTGLLIQGKTHDILARTDFALSNGTMKDLERARMFLELIGLLFPHGKANQWVLTAYAQVAFDHWTTTGLELPSPKTLDRLRNINWQKDVPVMTKVYQPVILNRIKTVWK